METIRHLVRDLKNKWILHHERKDRQTNEETRCYICLENERKLAKLSCSHHVHKDCLHTQVGHLSSKGVIILPKHGQCGLCGNWIKNKHLSGIHFRSLITELKQVCGDVPQEILSQQRVYRCYYCGVLFKEAKLACVEEDEEIINPAMVRCTRCKDHCHIHGDDSLSYKCRFCCNAATFQCGFGNHMCTICHEDQIAKPCVGESGGCDGNHPENGTVSVCYGCTMCMIERTSSIDRKKRKQAP